MIISEDNRLFFTLNHIEKMYKLYAAEEVIYFWTIDNSGFMMKRFKFTAVLIFIERGKCSTMRFYEGYHLGGNYM